MYTIKRAAELTNIGVATLRAWERRYGVVAPSRSEGRYRLYSDDDVRALSIMATLVGDGWTASEAAAETLRRVNGGRPAGAASSGAGAAPVFASLAQQEALSEDLAGGSSTALIDALPEFRELRDKAPDDLRDEWDTVTGRIGDLVDALEDAGVDPATYDRKQPPAGVTDEQRRAIDTAARALATPEMAAALDGVEQQARDVCRTPLVL